ncbi:MAG: PQQ-binding-like beta-propeller repeat protein [Bacteroidales bacterium]
MKRIALLNIILSLSLLTCSNNHKRSTLKINSEEALFTAMETNRQWPSYRGFHACGYMNNASLPDSFNIETGYHVKWNMEIPGLGLSCPAIWDDRVYLTTAISETDKLGYQAGLFGDIEPVPDSSEHRWMVYCIDKNSGRILWEREACRGIPRVKRHPKSSHANTTIATDGRHVVAFFGSEGLYCYDMQGVLEWKRDFGLINSAWNVVESAEWEFCSSPVIFQDRLILQADALNTAFVTVLDLSTGETIWKKDRDEISGWCTPAVYFNGTEACVAVNGFRHRGGYNLETGEEIWRMSGGGDIPIPTPIVWKDLIYFNSAHGRHAPLMAVKNNAEGVVDYPENDSMKVKGMEWFYDRGGSYMSSVLVYDSLLYRLRWNGNLTCYDARSGKEIYQQTVNPSSFIASPVAADGKIYIVSEYGELYIVQSGPEYSLLKTISLGEVSLVTPAIIPGMMFFRTASRLMAISDV